MTTHHWAPWFYKTMGYPVPRKQEQYLYIDETIANYNKEENNDNETYSWEEESDIMKEFKEYISKRWWLYKSIPFIRQIYLCNSISFNALHDESDIDLYIITNSWYIRFARFWSVFFFLFAGIKRGSKGKRKKVCLSFYSDEKFCNIYHIRKAGWDKYLSYRLAHCVLLYTDESLSDNYIREENKELLTFLPYHPQYQSINLWITLQRWNTLIKKVITKLSDNRIGKFIQYIIYIVWMPIVMYKKSKLKKHTQEDIVISPTMLKFHGDKRDVFTFRWKKAKRSVW